MTRQEKALLLLLAAAFGIYLASRSKKGQAVVDKVTQATGSTVKLVSTAVQNLLRNNNPGNIRWMSPINWQGQLGPDSRGFVIFDTIEHGTRAMAKNILTKYGRGVNTLRKLIAEWAPPTENDTEAYIRTVAAALKVDANAPIDMKSRLADIVAAMTKVEHGKQPYSLDQLRQWVALA